jgi:hypothetical protein
MYRPGLPYRIAFDWLAYNLSKLDGSVALVANNALHSNEMLRRLPNARLWSPASANPDETIDMPGIGVLDHRDLETDQPSAAVMLEPSWETMSSLSELTNILKPDSRLYAVVGGVLGRFLAERRDTMSGQDLVGDRSLVRCIQEDGWQVKMRFGVHGLRAIVWHYMSTLAKTLKRPDLQDRWHCAMRQHFMETGLGSHMSALVCLSAERLN